MVPVCSRHRLLALYCRQKDASKNNTRGENTLLPCHYNQLPWSDPTPTHIRLWGAQFVHWYNFEHRHSGIKYVTPAQRHAGEDVEILRARHDLYTRAKETNPRRWSGSTRDWKHVGAVTLNPEREAVVAKAVLEEGNKTLNAA